MLWHQPGIHPCSFAPFQVGLHFFKAVQCLSDFVSLKPVKSLA